MTKWVTFLLLLLAVLAYGLSKMRPTPPPEDAPTTAATPAVTQKASATPVSAEVDPPTGDSGTGGAPATKPRPTAPKFRPSAPATPAPLATAAPAATSTPTAVATPRVAVKPKADPFSKGRNKPQPILGAIKATTLSDSANGQSRTKFASGSESIYLTATPEGIKGNVELVATYRNILDENSEFSVPVPSSGPARRRSFRLAPPAGGWPSGPYQVAVKPKGSDQVLGLDRFEVLKPEEQLATEFPQPEYLDLVPDLQAEEAQSSFQAEDKTVLLRVSAQELPAGIPIRSVWSAVEVDRLTTGELIAVSSQAAPGPGQDAIFTFEAPPGGFHSGSYKVDIYFDQVLAGSQAFFIQPRTKDGQ